MTGLSLLFIQPGSDLNQNSYLCVVGSDCSSLKFESVHASLGLGMHFTDDVGWDCKIL